MWSRLSRISIMRIMSSVWRSMSKIWGFLAISWRSSRSTSSTIPPTLNIPSAGRSNLSRQNSWKSGSRTAQILRKLPKHRRNRKDLPRIQITSRMWRLRWGTCTRCCPRRRCTRMGRDKVLSATSFPRKRRGCPKPHPSLRPFDWI